MPGDSQEDYQHAARGFAIAEFALTGAQAKCTALSKELRTAGLDDAAAEAKYDGELRARSALATQAGALRDAIYVLKFQFCDRDNGADPSPENVVYKVGITDAMPLSLSAYFASGMSAATLPLSAFGDKCITGEKFKLLLTPGGGTTVSQLASLRQAGETAAQKAAKLWKAQTGTIDDGGEPTDGHRKRLLASVNKARDAYHMPLLGRASSPVTDLTDIAELLPLPARRMKELEAALRLSSNWKCSMELLDV